MDINFKRPSVSIIACTEFNPFKAAALLIFTKSTRLKMDPGGLEAIASKCASDAEYMHNELDYMAKTIRSSWEFLDVTFALQNVSRATAQQITRTRFVPMESDLFGSYAMQSQRVTNMSEVSFSTPGKAYEDRDLTDAYEDSLGDSLRHYHALVDNGMSLEDARGVLPMAAQCNLIVKFNLRMLVELIHARKSYRAQGEYRDIAQQMEDQLIALWPWVRTFLAPRSSIAIDLLKETESRINQAIANHGISAILAHDLKLLLHKVKDQLQGGEA